MTGTTGQRLGNYRLVRLLGRGGFAEVYLGEHVRLGTQFAIKLLATHLSDSEAEKFLAEARTIARLEHPHIIRILDFDVEQDIPFLVMSYASNGTLRQRYPKGTRLPLDVVLTYLKQAAAALQYAHDEKLVHRDIKPENMLMGRHNELLLSDFGIAVVAHSSRSQSTQEIMGTLSYMAPEQILGKPRPSSDQYALGVIVYEWLCGNHPFHGTAAEIATQHLHADMPPMLEAVVLKALEKDPHRRFASVQEFAAAPEQACQDVLSATTMLFPNYTAALSSAIPTTLGQVAFHASPTLADARLQPPKGEKHGIPRRALLSGAIGIAGLTVLGGGLLWWTRAQKPPLGSTLVMYTGHLNTVTTVAWSPDGMRIASGSWDQTVQVWDATSGTHPLIYRGHTTNVNAVAWSPLHTGQRIASASGNIFFGSGFGVQVWDAVTGVHIFTYRGHRAPVSTLAWSPDGKRIASASASLEKTVQVWDVSSGATLFTYRGHTLGVNAVAWSPDGALIASGSLDGTLRVWQAS
jgi:hypothetical protein